MTFDL